MPTRCGVGYLNKVDIDSKGRRLPGEAIGNEAVKFVRRKRSLGFI
jgi:hypothetical protein